MAASREFHARLCHCRVNSPLGFAEVGQRTRGSERLRRVGAPVASLVVVRAVEQRGERGGPSVESNAELIAASDPPQWRLDLRQRRGFTGVLAREFLLAGSGAELPGDNSGGGDGDAGGDEEREAVSGR
jgi:hypothetical protein